MIGIIDASGCRRKVGRLALGPFRNHTADCVSTTTFLKNNSLSFKIIPCIDIDFWVASSFNCNSPWAVTVFNYFSPFRYDYQSGYGNLIFSWQRGSVLILYTSVIKAWFRNLTLRLLALTHPVNSPSLAHYGWCAYYVWVFPSDVTLKDEIIKKIKS